MKILVYPHELGVGGSQLNAIEIAGAVNRLGHETIILGHPGPLLQRVSELGLEFVALPKTRRRPSPAAIGAIRKLAVARNIHILHGYEWPPALECYLAAGRLDHSVAVSTVMSMAVAPFIPAHVPLSVGTHQIAAVERSRGRSAVSVVEPPVDTDSNRRGLLLGKETFVRKWQIDMNLHVVVIVSRLAHQLKLEGILAAMEAVALLADSLPIQLVIVGDGPARTEVATRAAQLNERTGRQAVIVTGELADPRPAYDTADVVLGMGGSVLRAMAFGKPVVVQGEAGFWKLLDSSSLDEFLWQGWYGVGGGSETGVGELVRILEFLLPQRQLQEELGVMGENLVNSRFSLTAAARLQVSLYEAAWSSQSEDIPRWSELAALGQYASYEGRRILNRVLGREAEADDFNARPAAGSVAPQPRTAGVVHEGR